MGELRLFADPERITGVQLRAVYDALGLDPDVWKSTNLIEITPHAVTVRRFWRDEDGGIITAFDETTRHLEPVHVTTRVEVDWA